MSDEAAGVRPVARILANRHHAVWIVTVLVLMLVGLTPAVWTELHPDTAWLLMAAKLVLRGAVYGRDFVEVNPPLIVWLFVPVMWLNRVTGIAPDLLFIALVLGLIVLSVHLLRKAVPSWAALAGMPAIAMALAVFALPLVDFGEREHLAFIMTLPWAALLTRRGEGAVTPVTTARAIGFFSGLGFLLKPHFLLAWGAGELALRMGTTVRRQLLRPENVVLLAMGLGYAAVVIQFVPGYITTVLELGAAYYRFLNFGLLVSLLNGTRALTLLGTGLALWLLVLRADPSQDKLPRFVLSLGCGFLAGAIAQQKVFLYHYLGAEGCGVVVIGLVASRAESLQGKWMKMVAVGGALILAAVGVASALNTVENLKKRGAAGLAYTPGYDELRTSLSHTAANKPVMVLSMGLESAYPLLLSAGSLPGSRFPHLWLLLSEYQSQFVPGHTPVVFRTLAERSREERQLGREVAEDLLRWAPVYVIVPTVDGLPNDWRWYRRFDYVRYFCDEPLFAAAASSYRFDRRIGFYNLFVRAGRETRQGLLCDVPRPSLKTTEH